MEGGCSASSPSESAAPDGGASKLLANLPSRGNFSSTVLSSYPGGTRVYICNHDTSPPEDQIIRTNQTNILIRSLMLMKQRGDSTPRVSVGSRKRAAEKAVDGKAAGKRAMTTNPLVTFQDFQSLTVEKLRGLLRDRGLQVTGRKDELIARLRNAMTSSSKSSSTL